MRRTTATKPPKYSTNTPRPFRLSYAHKNFCEAIVAGMKPPDAYLTAGFKQRAGGSLLLKRPEIQDYIRLLRVRARHRHNVTVDRLVDHYYEAMDLARATDNAGAYVSAITALGKMLGLIVERTEVDHFLIPKPALKPGTDILLSPEEWAATWAPKAIEHEPGAKPNGHGNGVDDGPSK